MHKPAADSGNQIKENIPADIDSGDVIIDLEEEVEPVETTGGKPFNDRLVVLQFPSAEAVKTFYASPEYQEVMKFRLASSAATFLLAGGVPEGVVAPDDKVVKST